MKPDVDKTPAGEVPSDQNQVESSIPELIIQQMLEGLKGKPEFPTSLLERIQHLGKRGQLQKAAEVTKAIKAAPGGSNAAA